MLRVFAVVVVVRSVVAFVVAVVVVVVVVVLRCLAAQGSAKMSMTNAQGPVLPTLVVHSCGRVNAERPNLVQQLE